MTTQTAKTLEIIVTGQIDVCIPLELPASKVTLKKLALSMSLNPGASVEEIVKELVLDAVRKGFDEMEHRQSESSDVSERDLEIEIQ